MNEWKNMKSCSKLYLRYISKFSLNRLFDLMMYIKYFIAYMKKKNEDRDIFPT